MFRTRIALAALLGSSALFCGCSHEFKPGDISGSYRGMNLGINSHGSFHYVNWAKFEASPDGTFKGELGWTSDKEAVPGNAASGGAVVKSDTEEVIGLFNPKDGTFVLVETEESGTGIGILKPDGTLEFLKTQPGEKPLVSFATLHRED